MRADLNIRDFGFTELDIDDSARTEAEDQLFKILADNPEISDTFPEHTGFCPVSGDYVPFNSDFFEVNPDVAFRMSVSGKDVGAISSDLTAALDILLPAEQKREKS